MSLSQTKRKRLRYLSLRRWDLIRQHIRLMSHWHNTPGAYKNFLSLKSGLTIPQIMPKTYSSIVTNNKSDRSEKLSIFFKYYSTSPHYKALLRFDLNKATTRESPFVFSMPLATPVAVGNKSKDKKSWK